MSGLTSDQIAEARRLYGLGIYPARVAEMMSAHGRPAVTKEQVRAVVKLRARVHPAIDPEIRGRAIVMRSDGLGPKRISEALGISLREAKSATSHITVSQQARDARRSSKQARQNEQRRLKVLSRRLRAIRPIPVPEPVLIEVPAWVPCDYYEFFERRALAEGEFAAAAALRALLRGGSVASL